MTKLPVISGKEAVKALGKTGYKVDRQKGSHIILRNINSPYRRLTVPEHKEIAKGKNMKIADLSVKEFKKLIKETLEEEIIEDIQFLFNTNIKKKIEQGLKDISKISEAVTDNILNSCKGLTQEKL